MPDLTNEEFKEIRDAMEAAFELIPVLGDGLLPEEVKKVEQVRRARELLVDLGGVER